VIGQDLEDILLLTRIVVEKAAIIFHSWKARYVHSPDL
jgi:hypothetical protein